MRREKFHAPTLYLWLHLRVRTNKGRGWGTKYKLHVASDDQAVLAALEALWKEARRETPKHLRIVRIHVTLGDLTPSCSRQLDMLLNDDRERRKWEISLQPLMVSIAVT